MERFILLDLGYEVTTYALLIGTVAFTSWYPDYVHRRRELEERELVSQNRLFRVRAYKSYLRMRFGHRKYDLLHYSG